MQTSIYTTKSVEVHRAAEDLTNRLGRRSARLARLREKKRDANSEGSGDGTYQKPVEQVTPDRVSVIAMSEVLAYCNLYRG